MPQSSLYSSPNKNGHNALSRRYRGSFPTTQSPRRFPALFPSHSAHSDLVLAPKDHTESSLVPTMLYTMSESGGSSHESNCPTVPVLVSTSSASSSTPDLHSQRAELDKESHANRLKLQDRTKCEKATEATYNRQWKRYDKWWKEDQAQRAAVASHRGVVWTVEDSHPITALKVSLYLEYETNRCKLSPNGTAVEGTQPGVSNIKQIISALEYYRFHLQHEDRYRQCPESHKRLREDIRVSQYEAAAGTTEAERDAQMQLRVADGLQSETFTPEQLTQASIYYLQPERGRTPTQICTVIRDRSMLLTTTSMAFRGDNIRRLRWSDLAVRQTLLPDIGPEYTVPTLVAVTNKGKENGSGRLDEHGAFRHRLVEHCGVGALALHFFTLFHVSGIEIPDFLPDYAKPSLKNRGYRKWYQRLMYPGLKDDYVPMTLDNHIKRLKIMKKDTGIDIVKDTHSGRNYAVIRAREAGASVEGTMALGTWMAAAGGSFAPVYDRALPVDAMLGVAGFNARREQSYFVARSVLDPSPELCTQIFPWIEAEQEAYNRRLHDHGDKAHDNGLVTLLDLLRWFRIVLLQDAAVLYANYPQSSIFKYAPFDSPTFHKFSSEAATNIANAELEAKIHLQRLPEEAAEATRGMFTTLAMKYDAAQKSMEMSQSRMDQNIADMRTMYLATMATTLPAKKRKAFEAALSTPPVRPLPVPPVSRQCHGTTPNPHENSFSRTQIPPIVPSMDTVTSAAGQSAHNGLGVISDTELLTDTNNAPNIQDAASPSPQPVRTVSRAGNIYGYSVFQLSDDLAVNSKQHDALSALEGIFSYERLAKHEFEWDPKYEEWIPKFARFWTPPGNQKLTISDVWRENKFGIDGMFSIQELNARWDARWRRNLKPLKTEYSRRNKIILLIEKLSAKPNWNTELAFRFLHEKYPAQTVSSRTLSDFLIPQEKVTNEIIQASSLYPE